MSHLPDFVDQGPTRVQEIQLLIEAATGHLDKLLAHEDEIREIERQGHTPPSNPLAADKAVEELNESTQSTRLGEAALLLHKLSGARDLAEELVSKLLEGA